MSEPGSPTLADRTLRGWGVFEALYGVVLAASIIAWVPWKQPAINAGLVAYAALSIAAAPGLWRRARWGWRLAVAGGSIGFVLGVVVVAGLISSWAYLHAIYGDFGRGASIAALLFASVGVQVLGLYPALKLRALLRREVRAQLGVGPGLIRGLLGLVALPFLLAAGVHWRYALDPAPPVADAGRTEAVAYVRAALRGEARPALAALAGVPVGAGPLYVTLYDRGQVLARAAGEGGDLAEAVERATEGLISQPRLLGRRVDGGTLKFDRIVATGPVLSDAEPVVALSVNPGLDGLRRQDAETDRLLLPDDLIKQQAFGVAPLVPGIRELRFGLDAKRILTRLGLTWAPLTRVRTEGWVEFDGRALPAVRGNTPGPASGPAAWRAAAIAGGDFVLRQLMPDGRFHYQYYPLEDRHPPPGKVAYSLPRHAGTVYALALLFGETGEVRFKEGAEKAIAWLDGRIPPRCGAEGRACIAQGDVADLGSTALTLVGMLEYTRATGDQRYAPTIRRLVAFVLDLQREDGDFHHVFRVQAQQIDTKTRLMFYSEEAALALIMAHEVLGDEAYLKAAERALDYLTGPKYDYFVGRFIYGADHWTCIAAEEAWPRLKSPQYHAFCTGYAEFVRRLQYEDAGWDNADFRGHYGFSGFMVPQAPGAAGFGEAVVSTVLLDAHHHGAKDPVLVAQMAAGLDALAREQLRPDNSWLMPDPAAAAGGIRRSLVEQEVRIDFTQHALSALIRGAAVE